jgi:glucose/arabinose dehydrogenase
MPPMPQTGKNADAIRENLKRVKLPPGFKIDLYAVVPDARHMAVAPSTNMLFVGTRKNTVWAVTDRNSDGVADEVKPFAPSAKFHVPNGVCWTKDGFLIVVEHNRVINFPAAEFFYEGGDVAVIEVVPQGKLIPVEEESYNHHARTCRVGPDGMLYITLGQPYNVPPRDKLALFNKWGIGGIVRMNAFDGSKREVYATGIRNSVGLEFSPKDKSLVHLNQTDGMGDDIPPAKSTVRPDWHVLRLPVEAERAANTEFGYDKDPLPPNITDPQVYLDAHAADLGLAFYTGKVFPAKFQGGLFSAQHGSWNRTTPIGARIMFTSLKSDGTADKTEVFADGWLDGDTGLYRGRPVDVAMMKDGSMMISDDFAGALYRVTYVGIDPKSQLGGLTADSRVCRARRTRPHTGQIIRAAVVCVLVWDERGELMCGWPCQGGDPAAPTASSASASLDAPNLHSQRELSGRAVEGYRSSKREIASIIAKPLTDAEIADLAEWFASIAIEAKPPKRGVARRAAARIMIVVAPISVRKAWRPVADHLSCGRAHLAAAT